MNDVFVWKIGVDHSAESIAELVMLHVRPVVVRWIQIVNIV